MTVGEIAELIQAERLTGGAEEKEVTGGYAGDVLSVAMTKIRRGAAWITVQANMNALAAAVLREASCLIFPDGIKPEQAVADRARAEGIALLSAKGSAYDLAGRMYAAGLRERNKHE